MFEFNDKREDSWIGIYWRPAAAVIYLLICVFDFIIAPTYFGISAKPLNELIVTIRDLPPELQRDILTMKLAPWEPLTLKGSGMFHVAFGAILGASAWNRGRERISEVKTLLNTTDTSNKT